MLRTKFVRGEKIEKPINIASHIIIDDYQLPKGAFTEIYGGVGSGKTTVALQAAAQCQNNGGKVIFVDVEQILTQEHCRRHMIDYKKLGILIAPAENLVAAIIREIESSSPNMIIMDSINAILLEGYAGNSLGTFSTYKSNLLRDLSPKIREKNIIFIITNQIRNSLNTYRGTETTFGESALQYHVALRLKTTSESGGKIKVSCTKNKNNPIQVIR